MGRLLFAALTVAALAVWALWPEDAGRAGGERRRAAPTGVRRGATKAEANASTSRSPAGAESREAVETDDGETYEVVVRDIDGQPVVGYDVFFVRGERVERVATDRRGVVRFTEPHGRRVNACVAAGGPARTSIGSLGGLVGRKRIEHVVGFEFRLTVRVLLEGRPGLPEGTRLLSLGLADETRDPVTGTLSGRVRLAEPTRVLTTELHAPGYAPGAVALVLRPGQTSYETSVDLREQVELTFRVPVGESKPRLSLRRSSGSVFVASLPLERDGDWLVGQRTVARARHHIDLDGRRRILDLRPGEKRRVVVFAPAVTTVVTGRIVVPEGFDPGLARVRATAPERPDQGSRGERFRLELPDAGPWTVEARHPLLAPHEKFGRVRIVGSANDLALELVRAPLVRFSIAGAPDRLFVEFVSHADGARILGEAVRHGEGSACAAPPPGRYDLRIRGNNGSETILRDLEVGAADIDLEPIVFAKTVRVTVEVPSPAAAFIFDETGRFSFAGGLQPGVFNRNGRPIKSVFSLPRGRYRYALRWKHIELAAGTIAVPPTRHVLTFGDETE